MSRLDSNLKVGFESQGWIRISRLDLKVFWRAPNFRLPNFPDVSKTRPLLVIDSIDGVTWGPI